MSEVVRNKYTEKKTILWSLSVKCCIKEIQLEMGTLLNSILRQSMAMYW